jgi:zinc/manganese transport system substrate-binding protein
MRPLFVFCLCLWGLLLFAPPARADLRIVTTTPDLAALAKQVGKDHVQVTSLALHTQDPHWVDARPNLALELSRADMCVLTGLDLELGWLPTLLTGARNGAIQPGGKGYVDASEFVSKLEVPTGPVDRSMGDIHPHGNPHYLLDPRRAAKVASGLAVKMGSLDPKNQDFYRKNADEFVGKVTQWKKVWDQKLGWLRGKKVIGYHQSLPYLADWLGFTVTASIQPRPGIPPNPAHVAHVIDLARKTDVKLVVQESWHPAQTSKLVAEQAGVRLVVIPGAPDYRGGQSYLGFVNDVVARLAEAKPN